MNRERIARELVAVAEVFMEDNHKAARGARRTASRGTGVRILDDAMRDIERPMKAIVEARKDATAALVRAVMVGDDKDFSRMQSYLSDVEHHLTNLIEDAGRARNFVMKARDTAGIINMKQVESRR